MLCYKRKTFYLGLCNSAQIVQQKPSEQRKDNILHICSVHKDVNLSSPRQDWRLRTPWRVVNIEPGWKAKEAGVQCQHRLSAVVTDAFFLQVAKTDRCTLFFPQRTGFLGHPLRDTAHFDGTLLPSPRPVWKHPHRYVLTSFFTYQGDCLHQPSQFPILTVWERAS